MIDYSRCLAEVEEILKHLDRENYNKIPNEILEYINISKDKKYIGKDGIKKTEDKLTNTEWMDLQRYQPGMENSGRI